MIKTLKTIILLLIAQSLHAQELTMSSVDAITYNQYLNSNWDSLVVTGKGAIKNDIDFFYLQVRMGTAYYWLGNYRRAIAHFENAFKLSPTDAFIREYLYYSYLLAGRKSDAVIFSKRLTLDMKKQMKIEKPKFIDGLQSEYGYFINQDYEALVNVNNFDNDDLYTEQTVPDSYSYFNVGLSHAFANGTTFSQSYTNLKIHKLQQYQIEPLQAKESRRMQSNSNAYEYDFTTNQHQYYASLGLHPKVGLTITPAVHFLKTNSTYFEFDYDGVNTPLLQAFNYSTNEFLLYLAMAKESGLFTFGASVSYSNLNSKNQFQPGVSLIYYPLGNLNLYSASYLYYQSNGEGIERETGVIFNQKLGFKVKKVWFEGLATFGDFSEFNEAGGFVVYNSLDKIKSRYEGAVIIPINEKGFSISLRYQNLNYQGQVSQAKGNDAFDYTTFNYTNHLFIGGVSWKF